MNLLPDAYRPRTSPRPRTALLLIIAVELLLGAYVLQLGGVEAQQILRVSAMEAVGIQDPQKVRIQNLEGNQASLEDDRASIQKAREDLSKRATPWGALLRLLFSAGPPGIKVAAVLDQGETMELQGTAREFEELTRFRDRLGASDLVNRAEIVTSSRRSDTEGISFTLRVRSSEQ